MNSNAEHTVRRWLAWARLIRPPNLLTVPGDPLAGCLLAATGGRAADVSAAAPTVAAALAIYMAGLIWNDFADVAEDARTRPRRPIPSGAVARRSAGLSAVILSVAGLAFASLAGPVSGCVAVLLLGLVLAYDFGLKRIPLVGPLAMGLCRGLSVLLGATACTGTLTDIPVAAWTAALGMTLYIAAVSCAARTETDAGRSGAKAWLPAVAASLALAAVLSVARATTPDILVALVVAAFVWRISSELHKAEQAAAKITAIGRLIRVILLIQAAFCAVSSGQGPLVAAILLCAWPAAAVVSRRFYSS